MQPELYQHDYTAIEQRLKQLQAPAERHRLIGKGVFALALIVGLCALILASAWAWQIANRAPVVPEASVQSESQGVTVPSWPTPNSNDTAGDDGVVTTNFTLFREKTVDVTGRSIQVEAGHHFDTEDQVNFSHAWCYIDLPSDGLNLNINLGRKKPGEEAIAAQITSIEYEKSGLSRQETGTLFDNCPWLDGNPNVQAQASSKAFLFDEEVNKGSIDRLLNAIDAGYSRVELASPGGEIGEAIRGYEAMHAAGIETVATGHCASACTILFLAGAERSVEFEGAIGVHQWRTGSGFTSDADAQFTSALLLQLFSTAGVSENFYIAGARTPSAGMRWLTRNELREWGVVTAKAG